MNVDSVGLVRKHPCVMVDSVVNLPCVSFLVDFGAEHSGDLVLDDLEYSGRMNDHEVDVHASCAESTCGTVGCRCSQGNLGVEPCGRNADDSHVVVHLDFAVYVGVAVLCVTSDVALEERIDERIDEENSSLIGNFPVVKSCLCGLYEVGYVVASRQSSGCGCSRIGCILCESVQFVIVKAFYPLPLMVSHKFSISFQPC